MTPYFSEMWSDNEQNWLTFAGYFFYYHGKGSFLHYLEVDFSVKIWLLLDHEIKY